MIHIKLKAQSWSLDIALGVIIFVAAFFVFYALLNANPNTKLKALKEEAVVVIKQVGSEDSTLSVVTKNEIDVNKLNELKNLRYDDLKRKLNVEGDFCIYIEDDKGNIVPIESNVYGIGSSKIDVGGKQCTQKDN